MKKERLFYIDLIRAIAVICVFTVHYTRQLETAGVGFVNKILPDTVFGLYLGSLGVSLFFIVSGASLMYTYEEDFKILTFYKKRFLSIYPMFWRVYLLFFLLAFYLNSGFAFVYPKYRLLETVLGMDGYLMFYHPNYYILGEWFLGCIILLYLVFPVLLCGVRKYPKITIAVAAVIYIAGTVFIKSPKPLECMFFLRIPEMLLGMYFIKYIKRVKLPVFIVSAAVLLAGALIDVSQVKPIYVATVIGSAAFFVIVYISKYINFSVINQICTYLGKYSYAIFLTHHVLLSYIVVRFSGRTLSVSNNIFLYVLCVIVVLFVSAFVYKCDGLEKTLKRFLFRDRQRIPESSTEN